MDRRVERLPLSAPYDGSGTNGSIKEGVIYHVLGVITIENVRSFLGDTADKVACPRFSARLSDSDGREPVSRGDEHGASVVQMGGGGLPLTGSEAHERATGKIVYR